MAVAILSAVIVFLLMALLAAYNLWREALSERNVYKRWWKELSSDLAKLRNASIADAKVCLAARECIERIRADIACYDDEVKEQRP